MSNFGIQTWNANGLETNTGIRPMHLCEIIKLEQDQVSGTYIMPSNALSDGMKLNYFFIPDNKYGAIKRRFDISGNTITIKPGNGIQDYDAFSGFLFIYYEEA